MSDGPLVSVVMSVYNDAPHLAATLESVLSQEGVALEFVVVDDGSTDETGQILDAYGARDARLRVVRQANAGLTRALIRGCGLARGTYIARQDGGGDVSLPGRLRTQAAFLESRPEVVMTSCGTRFLGPAGETLYEVAQSGDELQESLEDLGPRRTRGPSCHPSTMFRRSAYESVGGYRAAFAVAQDQDLWLRLAETGRCVALPEVLYEAHLSRGSISANRRGEQVRTMQVILDCARLRRAGSCDRGALEAFANRDAGGARQGRFIRPIQDARFYYFIGCLLRKRRPEDAKAYFRKSLRAWIFNPKALIRLCLLRV